MNVETSGNNQHITFPFSDKDPTSAEPCPEKRQVTPMHCMLIISARKLASSQHAPQEMELP